MLELVDGVYTQRFNRLFKRDGSLFRGRYKALLVETDPYLLQVSRYIHLNPINKSKPTKLEDYEWSSYSAYFDDNKCPQWLYTNEILDRIGDKKSYRQYMLCGVDEQLAEIYSKKSCPSILGSKIFKQQCLKKINNRNTKESSADIKRCKDIPSIENIFDKVAAYFNVDNKEIMISRRGVENLPRVLSVLICRRIYGYKLSEIAVGMHGVTPAAISSIAARYTKRLNIDSEFNKLYLHLLNVVC